MITRLDLKLHDSLHEYTIHETKENGGVLKRGQTQLANKINAKQKSISRYETGTSMPSIATLVKIAKVLKKPAGEFLEE